MRTRHRAALVAALTVATAVFAATALAANTATVGDGAGTATTLHVSVTGRRTRSRGDHAIYVPTGYTAIARDQLLRSGGLHRELLRRLRCDHRNVDAPRTATTSG